MRSRQFLGRELALAFSVAATVLLAVRDLGAQERAPRPSPEGRLESAEGATAGAKRSPVRRLVVALASRLRRDRASPAPDHVRECLQLPIEHVGGVVLAVDARAPAPPTLPWEEVRAVVTSFRAGDEVAPWVWPFLERARAEHALRFVHFGHFAGLADEPVRLTAWLRGFGLAYDSATIVDPVQVELLTGSRFSTSYEGAQERVRTHTGPRSFDERNEIWIRTHLRKAKRQPVDERTPIVTGAWGGIALEPYALTPGGKDHDRRWHIDPFEFFAEALGLRGVPCPDPNVFSGRRAFFLHVDGDGFESVSTATLDREQADAAEHHCGQAFLDEIVDAYELPMSISVIVASLSKSLVPDRATPDMEVARAIFERPNVEIASHAVLHPLHWRRKMSARTPPRTVNWYSGIEGYEHSMVDEVRASFRFIDDWLVPPGKRCELMFWSGRANPDEETLRAVREAGRLNLNGGVSRWDVLTNSVGFVRPRGRRVGSEYQVYCGAPNENVYQGFFTTMPGAFWHVDQTLANCGRGRILKPANIYAHFYSAERPARLRALRRLLDKWGHEENTAPVFASDYVRAVLASREAPRIWKTKRGWAFADMGACRSVRIDDTSRPIDWVTSRGVFGERRVGRSRYLTLAGSDAELVFADRELPAPHLISANHILSEMTRDASGVRMRSRAWSVRKLHVGGFAPKQDVRIRIDGVERIERADRAGEMRVELAAGGDSIVELRAL